MTGGYPYEKIIRKLKQSNLLQKKVYLYTETKRHATSLQSELGVPVYSYPFPSLPLTISFESSESTPLKICALGGGRRDKGFGLLPAIIDSYNRNNKSKIAVKFVIQKPREQDRMGEALAKLKKLHNVILLDNQLDLEAYEECLSSCDVMIFPYDKNVYYSRGSGIVNEAVANGKPMVCTKDTSLGEQIVSNNGLCAASADEFADAVSIIIENMKQYRENAIVAATYYLERIDNNPVITMIVNQGAR